MDIAVTWYSNNATQFIYLYIHFVLPKHVYVQNNNILITFLVDFENFKSTITLKFQYVSILLNHYEI